MNTDTFKDLFLSTFSGWWSLSVAMEATEDVGGALTRVDRQLKIKHPQLSIEYKENSVDCKAFLHIWKPTDPSSQNLQARVMIEVNYGLKIKAPGI